MAMELLGFVCLFAVLAMPMIVLARAGEEHMPTAAPTPRTERAGLALVILCIALPVLVALLRFTIA